MRLSSLAWTVCLLQGVGLPCGLNPVTAADGCCQCTRSISLPCLALRCLAVGHFPWPVCCRGAAGSPRLVVDNCTLVVSMLASEQFLFKATLFRVRPAGFSQQLQQLLGHVSRWDVSWVEDGDSVYTDAFYTTAVKFSRVLVSAQPMVAAALPLPIRSSLPALQPGIPEYQLTHVGQEGLQVMQRMPSPAGSQGREVVMLTTNLTLVTGYASPPAAAAAVAGAGAGSGPYPGVDAQLRRFLATRVADTAVQHVLMGIVTPPIAVDVAYSNLVRLPPAMPAGYFGLVNMVLLHLPQGPNASLPDANVLLPDVWTHLLWSIPRWGFARPVGAVFGGWSWRLMPATLVVLPCELVWASSRRRCPLVSIACLQLSAAVWTCSGRICQAYPDTCWCC